MKTFKEYYNKNWEFEGASAKSIYGVHINTLQGNKHPYDPDDLTRCFQCLRMITGNEEINDWKNIIKLIIEKYPDHKEWNWIYNNFEKLYNSYFEEYDNRRMPLTYELMKEMDKL